MIPAAIMELRRHKVSSSVAAAACGALWGLLRADPASPLVSACYMEQLLDVPDSSNSERACADALRVEIARRLTLEEFPSRVETPSASVDPTADIMGDVGGRVFQDDVLRFTDRYTETTVRHLLADQGRVFATGRQWLNVRLAWEPGVVRLLALGAELDEDSARRAVIGNMGAVQSTLLCAINGGLIHRFDTAVLYASREGDGVASRLGLRILRSGVADKGEVTVTSKIRLLGMMLAGFCSAVAVGSMIVLLVRQRSKQKALMRFMTCRCGVEQTVNLSPGKPLRRRSMPAGLQSARPKCENQECEVDVQGFLPLDTPPLEEPGPELSPLAGDSLQPGFDWSDITNSCVNHEKGTPGPSSPCHESASVEDFGALSKCVVDLAIPPLARFGAVGRHVHLSEDGAIALRAAGVNDAVLIGEFEVQRFAEGRYFEIVVVETRKGLLQTLAVGVTTRHDASEILGPHGRIKLTDARELERAWIAGYDGRGACFLSDGRESKIPTQSWRPRAEIRVGTRLGVLWSECLASDVVEHSTDEGLAAALGPPVTAEVVIFQDGRERARLPARGRLPSHYEDLFAVVDLQGNVTKVALVQGAVPPRSSRQPEK